MYNIMESELEKIKKIHADISNKIKKYHKGKEIKGDELLNYILKDGKKSNPLKKIVYKDDMQALKHIRIRLTKLHKLKKLKGGADNEEIDKEIQENQQAEQQHIKNLEDKQLFSEDYILKRATVENLRNLTRHSDELKEEVGPTKNLKKVDLQNKIINSEWFKKQSNQELKPQPIPIVQEIKLEEFSPVSMSDFSEFKKNMDIPNLNQIKVLSKLQDFEPSTKLEKISNNDNTYIPINIKNLKNIEDEPNILIPDIIQKIGTSEEDYNVLENKIDKEKKLLDEIKSHKEFLSDQLKKYNFKDDNLLKKNNLEISRSIPELIETIKTYNYPLQQSITHPAAQSSSTMQQQKSNVQNPSVQPKVSKPRVKKIEPINDQTSNQGIGRTIVNMYCGSNNPNPNHMIPHHIVKTALESNDHYSKKDIEVLIKKIIKKMFRKKHI